jgi:hypothetical protein
MEPMTDAQIEALVAEQQTVCQQVAAKSGDLVDRLQALGSSVYYDPADDWFLLSIGEPGGGVVLEMADEWNWRIDPETRQILGLEIPNIAALERSDPGLAARIRRLSRIGAAHPCTHVRVPPRESRALAAGMRAFIPV